MEPSAYQGLFYLSSGAGLFVSLLFGLRVLGERGSKPKAQVSDRWAGKEDLEVIERVEECFGIVTLRLRRASGQLFPQFRPGQFLSVQIGGDEKTTRSYSICSSAANRANVQISVKRLKDGKGSGWVHSLNVGDRLKAFAPSGHFHDADLDPTTPRILIAGGVGITPVLSMIQTNVDLGHPCEMTLFYGMRSLQDLAFHGQLELLAKRHPRFKYFPLLSNDSGVWPYDKGYVTYAYIASKIRPPANAHYFMCGPSAMTEPLIESLQAQGVTDEQIHNEKFASPQVFDLERIPQRQARIQLDGKTYAYDGKQTLLEFLESQGVSMPYACRVGVCGSCKCSVEGKTQALTDTGLTASEKKAGYVLSCVTFPEGPDLKVAR